MYWNAIAELDLSIGLLMLILFGLLSLRHGHVSLPHIRFLCQCWLIALTPLEVQDYALCLLTVVLLQSFHSFEALLFLLLAYIGQLYMMGVQPGILLVYCVYKFRAVIYRMITSSMFICLVCLLLYVSFAPACLAEGISLENPVNCTKCHWTDYKHLIPEAFLNLLLSQPQDLGQLDVDGSFLKQFVTGGLLGDMSLECASKAKVSCTLKLVVGINLRSMVFACMVAAVFEHYKLGNGLVRCYVGKTKKTLRTYSIYTPLFLSWLKHWSPNNKVVPMNIGANLGPICMLFWIIGDGVARESGMGFATNCFSSACLRLLRDALVARYGIKVNIVKPQQLYVVSSSMPILRGVLHPLMPVSWLYKLYNFSPNGTFRQDLIDKPRSAASRMPRSSSAPDRSGPPAARPNWVLFNVDSI